jgi:hypothetical protein
MVVSTPPVPPQTPDPGPGVEDGVIEDARRRQRLHRGIAGAVITTAVVAGGLIAGFSGGGGSGSGHGKRPADPPGGTPPQVAHLSQAAVRADTIGEARALLDSLRLPVGATHTNRIRVPIQGIVGAWHNIRVHGNTASAEALWISPTSMATTIAYVKAHTPAGASESSYGSGGSGGQISSMDIDYRWPLIADKRGIHDLTGGLEVWVLELSNEKALVKVSAQASGLQPRPASEVVPGGVKAVTVRLQVPPNTINGHRLGPLLRDVITTPASIQQAVRLVDSAAITQPTTTRCPAIRRSLTTGELTVTYTGSAGAPALAQATVKLPAGWLEGGALAFDAGSSCDPINFSINGRPQTPLAGIGGGLFMVSIIKLSGFMPRLLATRPAS